MTFLGTNTSDGSDWASITSTFTLLVNTDDTFYLDDDKNFTDSTEGGVMSEIGPLTAQYDNASIYGNRFVLLQDPTTLSASSAVSLKEDLLHQKREVD